MTPWLYIIIASSFEVCWIFSLKMLDMKKITQIRPAMLMSDSAPWMALLPLIGYIIFGVGNIYFFSQAMKSIQASTAFAVWMGLALIFTKVADILVFHKPYNMQQIIFTMVILAGIIGLKWYE